jgi:hypothetical protein
VNYELNHLCATLEQESGQIPGSFARNTILCALHLDFHVALTQSNFSDPVLKFREEAANVQLVNNVLRNLKEIKNDA